MIQTVTDLKSKENSAMQLHEIAQKAVKQPKIALRILRYLKNVSPNCELAIRTYERNRGSEAEPKALELMRKALS